MMICVCVWRGGGGRVVKICNACVKYPPPSLTGEVYDIGGECFGRRLRFYLRCRHSN